MVPSQTSKLSGRHVEFLALGGSVGAGLFVESGRGIRTAGPGFVVAYMLAGATVFIIARCLAEMALEGPGRGTFIDCVRHHLGETVAFVTGWCYWFGTILAAMAELTGIGVLAHASAPVIPQWLATFVGLLCVGGLNRIAVRAFGEIEFWMALLKIAALAAFIGFGIFMLVVPTPVGLPEASLENLWTHGGVFPTGPLAFLGVLPLALVTFAGVELIGLAAAETRDPYRTLPRAVNGVILRLCIFYVGPMIIIMSIVPWTSFVPGESPFVLVLNSSGVPGVTVIMNVLLLSALASSCNSTLFGNIRALRSLAGAGCAPASLGELNARGVPSRSAAVSFIAIVATMLLNCFIPGRALGLLLSAVVVQVVVNWVIFLLAHLQLRRRQSFDVTSPFRTSLPTWCDYGALCMCATVIAALACDAQFRSAVVFSGVFFATLALAARRWLPRAGFCVADRSLQERRPASN